MVRYAEYKDFDHEVTLQIDVDDVRLKVVIDDTLNVFDLNGGLTDAQFSDRIRREQGFTLGIYLIRQVMDEIMYTYKKGFENQLEMIYFL